MFKRKVKPEDLSAQQSVIDRLNPEVQAKIEQDIIDICQKLKAWPSLLTDGEKAAIPGELRGIFTKIGGKMATAMVTGKDLDTAFVEILKVATIPQFIKNLIRAVESNLG